MFGISFIILGNMAGNAIAFAVRILEAAEADVTQGAVRGIALAVSVFACFIHAFSRRGGIWLSNILAVIKICILLLMIIATIIYGAGGFGSTPGVNRQQTLTENLDSSSSFRNPSTEASGYAQAFLGISKWILLNFKHLVISY